MAIHSEPTLHSAAAAAGSGGAGRCARASGPVLPPRISQRFR